MSGASGAIIRAASTCAPSIVVVCKLVTRRRGTALLTVRTLRRHCCSGCCCCRCCWRCEHSKQLNTAHYASIRSHLEAHERMEPLLGRASVLELRRQTEQRRAVRRALDRTTLHARYRNGRIAPITIGAERWIALTVKIGRNLQSHRMAQAPIWRLSLRRGTGKHPAEFRAARSAGVRRRATAAQECHSSGSDNARRRRALVPGQVSRAVRLSGERGRASRKCIDRRSNLFVGAVGASPAPPPAPMRQCAHAQQHAAAAHRGAA